MAKLLEAQIYEETKDNFAPCEIGTQRAKFKVDGNCVVAVKPACKFDFETCELGSQRSKVNSKLRNQLAKFSQVTIQTASEDVFPEDERLNLYEFEMSMMGELNFFLGLQIKQLKEGTFSNQAKYIKDLLKRFNMEESKTMKTPMSSSIKFDKDEKGLWYPKSDNFELIGFSDADFAGCKVERKSTSGTCHFLGHSLVSWHSKKQNSVALSTAEVEYIATEARRKARYDTTLFSSVEDYQRYKQNLPREKSFQGEGLFIRMGWLPVVKIFEPIFPTLRLCRLADAQGMGKPLAHSLTVSSQNLHHMICSILLPRGYLMMMHMISCCESMTRVLHYRRFLTRVFKDVEVYLSKDTDFEAPISSDTYDEQSLGRMKFKKALDGSWIRRVERPPV
ncbi:hypothetical protein AAG906_024485 [Vitis piasezkii]